MPSAFSDKLPAFEGQTTSKNVASHINAMYAAREAFVQPERSERIRRALRKNTRNTDEVYKSVNKVCYKRPNETKWKGPGVVIGVEGPVVFVRHGGSLVRVHRCRIQKVCGDKVVSSGNTEAVSSPRPSVDEVENTSNDSCKLNSDTSAETGCETDKSEGCRKSSRLVKKPDWLNDYVEDVDEVMLVSDIDVKKAKMRELESWGENEVYLEVPYTGQKCVSTRWVYTFKTINDSIVPKARLVARGFEEYNQNIQKDSPTCAHESLRLIIPMDIKTAFLQGQSIDRDVYIKPPIEAKVNSNTVWKLNKCVYGLSDASLNWYCRVKSLLLELGACVSKVDPAVCYWLDENDDVYGMLACHVDDFIGGGGGVNRI